MSECECEKRAASPFLSCRCQHTDIIACFSPTDCHLVRQGGFTGDQRFPDSSFPLPEDVQVATIKTEGELQAGAVGRSCCDATYDEIEECLRVRSVTYPGHKYLYNCQVDVVDSLEDCCLEAGSIGFGNIAGQIVKPGLWCNMMYDRGMQDVEYSCYYPF